MKIIPLVDLKNLPEVENVSENAEWISTAEKIRGGLGTIGFLYLINHGIPKEIINNVFSLSHQFFDLPTDVKMKYRKDTSSSQNGNFNFSDYNGYTPVGGEKVHSSVKQEVKEAFDWLDMERGNYPTDLFPEFYKSIQTLDSQCKQLTKKLLKLVAISLKLDDVDFFVKCCRHFDDRKNYEGIYNIRVQRYPPISDDEEAKPGTVRLGEHSDYGLLTLLFQDDVGGLEVKTVDGEWVYAAPVPDSIVINTGDLIEFWTGGVFPATPHRISIPEVGDEKRNKARHSVVFFNGPDFSTTVTPLDLEKTPAEQERLTKHGKIYSKKTVNAAEHMLGRVANQY